MKRIFQFSILIILVIGSFIYSEKTTLVVREYDQIMIKIKENASKKNPVEAIIKDDTIIPGVSGYKANINKSYLKMKQYGKYNNDLYVYDKIKPKNTLKTNKDKYIIKGNYTKQKVSIILLGNDLKKMNVPLNLFISEVPKNFKKIKNNIKGYYKYNDWLKSALKANHITLNYCFNDHKCINKLYNIRTDIIKNNYLIETKKKLENGAILTYQMSNSFWHEYSIIINYIESKGYKIVYLEELLKE